MTNEDRLPPYEWFVEEFGRGFITDTYSTVRDTDGYEEAIRGDLNELTEEFEEPYHRRASAGSVASQHLEMFWSMHRDDFWSWEVERV